MKLIFFFLISFPAFAAGPSFSLLLNRKYDKAFYKITQEGKVWICETNHFPYFEAKENPLAKLNWSEIEKESKSIPKDCANRVTFENALKGKAKTALTCLTQKETLSLYERISTLCRSQI